MQNQLYFFLHQSSYSTCPRICCDPIKPAGEIAWEVADRHIRHHRIGIPVFLWVIQVTFVTRVCKLFEVLFQLYLFLLDTEKKTVLPAYKYTTLAL